MEEWWVAFSSLQYAVFFTAVLCVYWRLPHRAQTLLLLVASYLSMRRGTGASSG